MPTFKCVNCSTIAAWNQPRFKCARCDIWMAPDERKIILQNSHQSGDTYGVGMALVVEPTCEVLFLASPGDTGYLEKMSYYAALGVEKDRLGLLMLCKEGLAAEMGALELGQLRQKFTVYEWVVADWEPNQLYQLMANPKIFDRPSESSYEKDHQALLASHSAAKLPYIDLKKRARLSEVGTSTRLVAEKIQKGLKPVFTQVWTAVSESKDRLDGAGLVQRVAADLVRKLTKNQPNGVMLLWVRSLSGTERKELTAMPDKDRKALRARREKGEQIDDLFWSLSKKRNPQHLMTPQLFTTLDYLARRLDYAVVPIGDEVLFDEFLAATNKGAKGDVFVAKSEDNLINFWTREGLEWFGGPERRVRQTFLLWELFRRLSAKGIPLVQVGLRSGEMEKAAYLGVPTLYLEEAVSETGGRMLPVTVGGEHPRNAEPGKDAKQWWKDANKLSELVSGKLHQDAKNAQSQVDTLLGNGKTYWEGRLKKVNEDIEQGKLKLATLREARAKHSATQLNALLFSVTDHSALASQPKGGLPYFFRLTTKHVVGLYGAPSAQGVEQVRAWLRGKFEEDEAEVTCPSPLLRGTLTELEVDLAFNLLLNIHSGFAQYLKDFFPKPLLTA